MPGPGRSPIGRRDVLVDSRRQGREREKSDVPELLNGREASGPSGTLAMIGGGGGDWVETYISTSITSNRFNLFNNLLR